MTCSTASLIQAHNLEANVIKAAFSISLWVILATFRKLQQTSGYVSRHKMTMCDAVRSQLQNQSKKTQGARVTTGGQALYAVSFDSYYRY